MKRVIIREKNTNEIIAVLMDQDDKTLATLDKNYVANVDGQDMKPSKEKLGSDCIGNKTGKHILQYISGKIVKLRNIFLVFSDRKRSAGRSFHD